MLSRNVFMALFCLLLFMQNLFLLHQQLVIVIVLVARIRLLRILRVHLAQLKWWEVMRSRSLRNPYFAKFDDPMTDGWMSRKKWFSRLTKFLQPPKLVDGIFEVSLRLQKFWWVLKIVRTRNGFVLTDFFAIQTKFRVVLTGPKPRMAN